MGHATVAPGPEAFFLPATPGQRFCLFYPAAGFARAAVVYIAPFGDEMNKSRRMAALQARALAAAGIAVLLPDLHGCGDSSGDFGEARWQTWLDDIGVARQWLAERCPAPQVLLGLRLGALLTLDHAAHADTPPAALLLWQPVTSGATFLNQFLRLRVANDMLADDQPKSGGTRALRDSLRAGQTLEVAGYDIDPAMADALDGADAATLAFTEGPVHWFELASAPGKPSSPATLKTVETWRATGATVHLHTVEAPAFWATQEIAEAPALLAATSAVLEALTP